MTTEPQVIGEYQLQVVNGRVVVSPAPGVAPEVAHAAFMRDMGALVNAGMLTMNDVNHAEDEEE